MYVSDNLQLIVKVGNHFEKVDMIFLLLALYRPHQSSSHARHRPMTDDVCSMGENVAIEYFVAVLVF